MFFSLALNTLVKADSAAARLAPVCAITVSDIWPTALWLRNRTDAVRDPLKKCVLCRISSEPGFPGQPIAAVINIADEEILHDIVVEVLQACRVSGHCSGPAAKKRWGGKHVNTTLHGGNLIYLSNNQCIAHASYATCLSMIIQLHGMQPYDDYKKTH